MDQLIEEVPAVSGPLQKYRVTRGGVETVMKLSDADAARLGVSPDALVDGASTITPVQPVADSETEATDGGGGDGTADDGAQDSGGTEGVAAGDGPFAQPVQSAADSGGDGQTPSPPEVVGAQAKAPAKKAPAKRQTSAANKARTTAATKAAGDGGS
ncbi:hypothetical protein [Streptomyces sp. NPDC010273]|uniref:hypothetical protein n=1 Tax=Streptomyces sp. NPDC010273 TaxID=3364829 RepID=UPI0036E64921